MKKKSILIVALLFFSAAISSSFKNANRDNNPPGEFEILLEYLETNASYLQGDGFPIIMADEVRKNLKNPKQHIIDIRTDSWFEYGHIKNAANVASSDLLDYFKTKINPEEFEQIVLVCYSGQSAAYFTSLLRLAGYDNAYSMKWGMSSWREDFAEGTWLKNTSNDFATNLEVDEKVKEEKGEHPTLNTGKTDAKEILNVRLEELFAVPYKEYIIKSEDLFADPSNFYIINYWDEAKCDGHIPGSLHYHPNASITKDLITLPIDEKVVVYEETGQKAAYVVAYLNVLGYDAGNLAYGENGFMNTLLKKTGGDAFTKKEINMFPVIE
ncbi:rhodanese-like domain-containing protein [Maribacter sp. HTCC2170]|uniref:rhodanese-like domain-containing protein n=1 Tax=Maribacter sp. (strain HTCC2170 / KCCM 42371) TaxID=313603 RepID=UPI00006AFC6F|nr:rhodanese-like domain-containing protein [Maribacter sp. HTCC2170]EAR01346.1 rhodanese-related sulfurtransferase [Maribacter sp. HTCC2170]